MIYLVVHDKEDKGVYRFDSRGVAERIATYLKSYVFMHDDELDKALNLSGVTEPTDAIFLIRKYNSKAKNASKSLIKSLDIKTENTHSLVTVFEKMRKQGNTIEISMINGEQYIFSVKSYFILQNSEVDNIMSSLLTMINDEVQVNTDIVDAEIKVGRITMLSRSTVEFMDKYMLIGNCDDKYSPNCVDGKNGFIGYKHCYNRVAINMDAVASIALISDFNFGSNRVINSPILIKYLLEKMAKL